MFNHLNHGAVRAIPARSSSRRHLNTVQDWCYIERVHHPNVVDVRVLGGAAAIECARPVDIAAAARIGVEHGVWLRPFGRLVYAMPPYVCSTDDLRQIAAAMTAIVTSGAAA